MGIEKETLVYKILLECAELEVLFPRPETMKQAIGLWSKSRQHAWSRMYEALTYDYNAFHNYIRSEDTNETIYNTIERDDTGKRSNYTRAFNAESQTETTSSEAESRVDEEHDHYRDTLSHIKGNIGVVSMQQHLKEELEVRKNDFYSIIVNEFKKEFCLLVY